MRVRVAPRGVPCCLAQLIVTRSPNPATWQILDARNPLLYRCPDLETYIHELDPAKKNLLLLNKADLLTEQQRCAHSRAHAHAHAQTRHTHTRCAPPAC